MFLSTGPEPGVKPLTQVEERVSLSPGNGHLWHGQPRVGKAWRDWCLLFYVIIPHTSLHASTEASVAQTADQSGCSNAPLLHQAADDTQSVVDGALRLLDHQLVGAAHHDAHRLTGVGAACDLWRGRGQRETAWIHFQLEIETRHMPKLWNMPTRPGHAGWTIKTNSEPTIFIWGQVKKH